MHWWLALVIGLMLQMVPCGALCAELPDENQLTRTLEQLRVEQDLPSLSAAIRNDAGVVASAVGLADVEQKLPQSVLLGMPGGSTGKSFVAATAMRLVEEHAIELSDPISLYVGQRSWYKSLSGADEITIEHLLTHTSGIPDHVDDFDFAWDLFWRRIQSQRNLYQPHELIEFILDDGLQFEPGTDYQYTDTGYLVLGLVLEAATDLTYFELLENYVLQPHQLAARPADNDMMADVSQGYVNTTLLTLLGGFNGPLIADGVMQIHPRSEWTGGGLVNTPTVLTQFYHKLANGEIVAAQTYQQMIDGGLRSGERGWHYGYGLYVNGDVVGHGGWFPGYSTNARHFTSDNVTIAVQSNTDADFDQGKIMRALLQLTR